MVINNFTSERRYDIDWIRVIAIALLVIYHGSNSFRPDAKEFKFIQSDESLPGLWIVMSMMKIWRIPILFFISGMGVYFSINRRNWKSLILERTRRILVPLIFGYLVIVPIHVLIFQKYYHLEFKYFDGLGYGFAHLWFLANIYGYVVILSPIFFILKRNYNSWIFRISRIILRYPFSIYLFIIPFILEVIVIEPYEYGHYLFTRHGFILGLMAFFLGFYFVAVGSAFWNSLKKLRFINLILAFGLYIVRLTIFDYESPDYMMATESLLWIFAIFGLGYSYLNHPSPTIAYLSKAAYPIYIIHMISQYLSDYFIFPLNLNTWLQYMIVLILSFLLSFIIYEFAIRRINFLRPLFGLKLKH